MSSQSFTTQEADIFSQSTRQLLEKIRFKTAGVTLLELMELLYEVHFEYSTFSSSKVNIFKEAISYLSSKQNLIKLSKYNNIEWPSKVLSIISKQKGIDTINGRMFLLASIFCEFEEINKQINDNNEWSLICKKLLIQLEIELKENNIGFVSQLTTTGISLRNIIINSKSNFEIQTTLINTQNLSDSPSDDDALSRKSLAIYLAKRIRHIYNRDVQTFGNAFFMHIDGAWGSGKSTLMRFLQNELEKQAPYDENINTNQVSEKGWIIVNFNAWENQRLDPPWWFLLQKVYSDSLKKLFEKNEIFRYCHVYLSEKFWRLKSNGWLLITAGLAAIIFSISLGTKDEVQFQEIPLVKTISFLTFIWALAKNINSGLVSGSSKAAQVFIEENSSDPLNLLTEHFKKLIIKIKSPVAIFIDDLDRCNKDYGIKLLEGLQTIYKNAPVVYIIGADRRWISTMYESQYSIFAPVITKPAKPFGYIFLDKVFQLIVELPEISRAQKQLYWGKLLNIYEKEDIENEESIKAKIDIKSSDIEEQVKVLNSEIGEKSKQLAGQYIVENISIQKEEKIIEHKLQQFVDLIEPNPRSMKRLINDVGTLKAMTILYQQSVDENQIILWAILKQNYPSLAEYLWEEPELIKTIFKDKSKTEFSELLKKQDIKNIFSYKMSDKIVNLDFEFLQKMKFQFAQ